MIKLKKLLVENKTKEELVLDFIRELIKGTKYEGNCFVAGGYVRDLVMSKKSKDIDITVSLPNGGIDFANFVTNKTNCNSKSNPVIFQTYGTAKFNFRNVKYKGIDISDIDIECVMTRKEQYKDTSRKPDVEFGTPIEDVERRDLTINSLLYDISNKKILDLTGKGLSDIKNKIIRTPLDANVIFREDPLRMMRCVRFACKFGWKLSNDMIESIKKNADRLQIISKERIQDEFNKILLSNSPDYGIKLLMDSNLMKYIIPEYYQLVSLQQNDYHQWDAFDHSMHVLKLAPANLVTRLSALFHDLGKTKTRTVDPLTSKIHFLGHEDVSATMANTILKNLKYPTNIIDSVIKIITNHMRTKSFGDDMHNANDKTLRRLVLDLGDDLQDFLDLVHADNSSHGEHGWKHNLENQIGILRDRLKTLGDFASKEKINIPIDGKRIMSLLKLKQGKDVGDVKRAFEDIFLDDPEKINKMSDKEIDSLIYQIYDDLKENELKKYKSMSEILKSQLF